MKHNKVRLLSLLLSAAMLLPACASEVETDNNTDDSASEQTEMADAQQTEEDTEELTPYSKVSDRKKCFTFNTDADGRGATQIGSGDTVGCRFSATADFNELDVSCPSYSDDVGSMKFTLYKWDTNYTKTVISDPVATETFVNFSDNETLYFEFDTQSPGEYMLTLSDGHDGVGVWNYTSSATGTLIYNNGTEADGVFTMDICYLYTPNELYLQCQSQIDLSKTVTTPDEIQLSDDDPIVVLDAMADTWVATDALGRTLPTNAETGDTREGKYVGLFFWTWHCVQSNNKAFNLTEILADNPELAKDYYNAKWQDYLTSTYFWDTPIYGYYNGLDEWVYRKQAELLANSGIDVIIFDNTNGTYTWKTGVMILLETFEEARAQGVNTPKISFLLPFADGNNTVTQLRDLYLSIYRDGLYQDLWFYWEGKPLIMSYYGELDTKDQIESEIRSFFTFRPGIASYDSQREYKGKKWTWLSVYPQAVTYRADGTAEYTTVGVAQNWSDEVGLTAMNGKNVFGRTYTSKGYDTQENALLYGANFAEQFEYAIDVDPDFIFITGWNEWIAGRYEEWCSVKNAFPDEYSPEYSRDIEPSAGILGDNYYYQMVSFVRQYKGTRAVPDASDEKTIDISSDVSQWDDVSPKYIAYLGNTFDRDCDGYGSLHYTDTTGRNDLTAAKMARDGDNLYFMCQCAEDISEFEADTGWMRLYIDIDGVDGGWNTFNYIVEMQGNGIGYLMKYSGSDNEWSWEKVSEVNYTVQGNTIQLSIPKTLVGIKGNTFTVNFKWSDNTAIDGDIMDFYIHGDVAPGGRFKYQYNAK